MPDSESYEVVPRALRANQRAFDDAAETWRTLKSDLDSWTLHDGDLGLIGAQAGIVTDYNEALRTIRTRVENGAATFDDASDTLARSADHYDAVDQTYYEQFGWYEHDLGQVS